MANIVRKSAIELSCPQLGTTDYFSYDATTTFNDILNELKEKYVHEIISYMKNFQNIRRGISLNEVTVKLHYIDREGNRQTVGLFTKVRELKKTQKFSRIYWEAEPIGGRENF
ncbi:MAG: hypothetical protein ACTSQI_05125 [Candidatus Helarchaeota archaeon]